MAIAESFAGTQAVDNATEWSMPRDASFSAIVPQTGDGVYQIFLDLSDMVTGDQLYIRIYEDVGGTQAVTYVSYLYGPQPTPIWVSPTFVLTDGWDVTAIMLSATTCTVDWSIRAVT